MANIRTLWRVARWLGASMCVLIVGLVVTLRSCYHGEDLGEFVAQRLNERMRGHIEIGSVDWSVRDLPSLVTGGWFPVDLRDVKVFDEDGILVLDAPRITAKLDAHAAMFGRHDLVVDDLVVHEGARAVVREIVEMAPSHEYDWTVVSLLAAFANRTLSRSFYAGLWAEPSMGFHLRNFEVRDATIDFDFPDRFKAHTEHVSGGGTLYFSSADPLSKQLYYSLTPTAKSGWIEIANVRTEIKNLHVSQLAQLPKRWPSDASALDVEFAAAFDTEDGSHVTIDGALRDYWQKYYGGEYDIRCKLENAGALAQRLSGGELRGDQLQVEFGVHGPYLGFGVEAKVRGLEYRLQPKDAPPIDLLLEDFVANFDFPTNQGVLPLVRARRVDGPGEVEMSGSGTFGDASIGQEPSFELALNIREPIDIGPFVPQRIRAIAGGSTLSGQLHIAGANQEQSIDEIALTLGNARITGGIERKQALESTSTRLEPQNLKITLGGHSSVAATQGFIDVSERTLGLGLEFVTTNVGALARALRAPALATSITGTANVRGSFDEVIASASAQATGVPFVGRVESDFTFHSKHDLLRISRLAAIDVGGTFSASGTIRLGSAPEILGVDASAVDIDLSRIPFAGQILTGRASGTFRASGPFARVRGQGELRASDITIAGDPYKIFEIKATRDPEGSQRVALLLASAAGGILNLQAKLNKRNQLSGTLTIEKFRVHDMALWGGAAASPVGGIVDVKLSLSGTPEAPALTGTISALQTWLGAAFLGPARIDLLADASKPGVTRVSGQFFQGRMRMQGEARADATFDIALTLNRLELDPFLPSLAERFRTRAWVSGTVAVASTAQAGLTIAAQLSETVLTRDNEDASGRPAPITLRNQGAIYARYANNSWQFEKPLRLMGAGIRLELAGGMRCTGGPTCPNDSAVNLSLTGQANIAELKPYFRDYVESLSGNVKFSNSRISGTFKQPTVHLNLDLANVKMQPIGQDETLSVPAGRIRLSNSQLLFEGAGTERNFRILLDDQLDNQSAELVVIGGIGLRDFRPSAWTLQLRGELAGKLLAILAPRSFSSASGVARIVDLLVFSGTQTYPHVSGTLAFATERPLTLTPRGGGVELRITDGTLDVAPSALPCPLPADGASDVPSGTPGKLRVCLERVGAWVDDEGRITIQSGVVDIENWRPTGVDLLVRADNVPMRVPGSLDLSLNFDPLRIDGALEPGGLAVSGKLIVNGQYTRDFNVVKGLLQPARASSGSEGGFLSSPLVATALLDLGIETQSFRVHNNIANIELRDDIRVQGTPSAPLFDGQLRIASGTFKLPYTRVTFTETSGDITFRPIAAAFPKDTPRIELSSDAQYRDSTGQEHLLTLKVSGVWSSLFWDLSTNTGLDNVQTLALIVSGSTVDELKRTLGDRDFGDRTQLDRTSGAPEDAYEGVLRGTAGDLLDLFLGNRLKGLTKLDIARLEIGTSSVGFYGEIDFRNLRAIGEVEKNLRGLKLDIRGELRVTDSWSFEGEWLRRDFDDDAEDDTSDGRVRLVWRRLYQ